MSTFFTGEYDVAVLGAGHAGCESALACARMGLNTLCLTLDLDAVCSIRARARRFIPCACRAFVCRLVCVELSGETSVVLPLFCIGQEEQYRYACCNKSNSCYKHYVAVARLRRLRVEALGKCNVGRHIFILLSYCAV